MGIKLINHISEIENGVGWKKCTDFPGKRDLVNVLGHKVNDNYAGRKYRIIAKREKNVPPAYPKRCCCLDAIVRICSLVKDFFLWLLRKLHMMKPEQREIFYAILLRTSLPQNPNEKAASLFLKHFRSQKARTLKAATVIQKHFRGRQTRKSLLSRNLFKKYSQQCHKALERNNKMKRASNGVTPVYLPQETPGIVLKKSGRKPAVKRFHEMQQVKAILESQRSSHLVVPKARLCKDFLVEERLPINTCDFHNMDLYISNSQLFDEPIRELTRLSSRGYLSDLVQYRRKDLLGRIPGITVTVRYDNFPFYLVEKSGKKEVRIGLIDLENFGLRKTGHPKDLWDLVRAFPYHFEIIKKEAQKLNYNITADLKLEAAAAEGQLFLKAAYIDHLEWLRKKDLSKTFPAPLQITPQRIPYLITLVEKALLELNQEISKYWDSRKWDSDMIKKPLFNEIPKETCTTIATKVVEVIIGNLNKAIAEKQKELMTESSAKHLAESEVVRLRSPIIIRSKIYEGIETLISQNSDNPVSKSIRCRAAFGDILMSTVLCELRRGGELLYFDPAYDLQSEDLCWIRY